MTGHRLLGIAACAVMLTASVAPHVAAQAPAASPTAAGCAEITAAKTEHDVDTIYQRVSAGTDAKASAAWQAHDDVRKQVFAALSTWEKTKKELAKAQADLANLVNEAVTDSMPWLKVELAKAEKEFDELNSTNKTQAAARVKDLSKRYQDAVKAERETRALVDRLKRQEETDHRAYNQMETRRERAEQEARRLDEDLRTLFRCRVVRLAQFNPQYAAAMARIEAAVAKYEKDVVELVRLADQAPAICPASAAAIAGVEKSTARLEAALRKLATDANVQAAKPATTTASVDPNVANAGRLIAALKKHASEAQQAACTASQTIIAAPRDPPALTLLVEAQRQSSLAEADVTMAANLLNDIRAAHAAAAPTAASAAAGLAGMLEALRALSSAELGSAATVKTLLDLQAFTLAVTAAEDAAQKSLDEIKLAVGPVKLPDGWLLALLGTHVGVGERRVAALKGVACAMALLANLDRAVKGMAAVQKALKDADTAVAAAQPKGNAATDQRAEIEKIFAVARGDADTIAADAVKAIACAAAAQKAVIERPTATDTSPPVAPPPVAPVAPPPVAANVAGLPPPQDFGANNQDFSGRWVDPNWKTWTVTIVEGKKNAFTLIAVLEDRLGTAKVIAQCHRTGVNKAECLGVNNPYEDPLRSTVFDMKVVIYVHDGQTLACTFEVTSASLVRMKIAGQPPAMSGPQKGLKNTFSMKKV